MKETKTPMEAKCLEVMCPIWGWVKVPFNSLIIDYWEDCRDKDIDISFPCVCGQIYPIKIPIGW